MSLFLFFSILFELVKEGCHSFDCCYFLTAIKNAKKIAKNDENKSNSFHFKFSLQIAQIVCSIQSQRSSVRTRIFAQINLNELCPANSMNCAPALEHTRARAFANDTKNMSTTVRSELSERRAAGAPHSIDLHFQ